MPSKIYDLYSATRKAAAAKPRPKPLPLTDDELSRWANFANTTDVHAMANYLGKKGLVNASQLIFDNPNTTTREGITNTQADWKTSATSAMLMRARKLGIQTPSEVMLNKDALMGSLDPRIKDAIINPEFTKIHPNYWEVFNGLLRDQYANEAANVPLGTIATK